MIIDIPGYKTITLSTLLLDYNGTIAIDGMISDSVKERLCKLSEHFKIVVLTADTHGTARSQCEGLPLIIHTFPTGNAADYKAEVLHREGAETCVCLGNGRNDIEMFRDAALSIAIMGQEGMCSALLKESDICVTSIEDGLDLLLNPKRIIADLRG
jgi:P-type E1-E2 ATPase